MKKLIQILKKIAPWLIYGMVALFIYVTLRDNLEEVKQYDVARPWFLAAAVVMFAVQFLANALVWARLMNYSGSKISVWNSIRVYVSSFIIRYIPGNVWAIAARAAMNREHDVKISTSIWGWVIENVSFLLVGLCLGVFALAGIETIRVEYVVLVSVSIIFCAIFLLRYTVLERAVRFVMKRKFPDTVAEEVSTFDLSYRKRLKILLLYVVPWVFFSLQFLLVLAAVSDVTFADVPFLIGVNSLAWSIGYLSLITPSGTGVREGIIILALGTIGTLGGVDAIAIALLARLTTVLGEVLLFGIVKLVELGVRHEK